MTKKLTQDKFVKDIFNLVGDEFSVIGEYTLSKNPVLMRHNVCGHEWSPIANNFKKRRNCPNCTERKTTEIFKKEVSDISKGKLEVIGEYIDYTTPVLLKCKVHDITFTKQPTIVLRGRKVCKKCNADYLSEVQRKPSKVFYDELNEKHKGHIVCEDTYINTHTRVNFRCLRCETEFKTEPNAVLRISGCPVCAESKGEAFIREYLKLNNIKFTSQKRFPDCKFLRELPFDFYIPSLNLLIEYNGKQHYMPIEFFGGIQGYVGRLLRDNIKRKYAEIKGIKLLEMPYTLTGNDVEKVLENYIKVRK